MKMLVSRRPSPSLVISLLALFVALGGSAYAASKVGSKDIKANAITAGKIKKNAVTTAKIKNDAVTGTKVRESTLGEVPTATRASFALSADRADVAEEAASFSRYFTSGVVRASVGQTVTLASVGPFAIVGECTDEGGIARRARISISTAQPGSFLFSLNANYQGANFNPGLSAELGNDIADDEPEWQGRNAESMWTAASPDGSILLQGFANNGVHVFGAECAFNLTWTQSA